jgi:hypothetical protein
MIKKKSKNREYKKRPNRIEPEPVTFIQEETTNYNVNHPEHYGGESNPFETIKVIEAWKLNFNIGNAVKYLSRHGKKGDPLDDLRKAIWYIQREIDNIEQS